VSVRLTSVSTRACQQAEEEQKYRQHGACQYDLRACQHEDVNRLTCEEEQKNRQHGACQYDLRVCQHEDVNRLDVKRNRRTLSDKNTERVSTTNERANTRRACGTDNSQYGASH
jgi:hypothetical protein